MEQFAAQSVYIDSQLSQFIFLASFYLVDKRDTVLYVHIVMIMNIYLFANMMTVAIRKT